MRTIKLSRRRALNAGGIAVALPTLEAMLNGRGRLWSDAHAAGIEPPKRLIIFHWPTGVVDPKGWATSDALTSLQPYRASFNIVSGMGYGPLYKQPTGGDVHGFVNSYFTGYQGSNVAGTLTTQSGGPSVWYLAGRAIGSATRFSYLSTVNYSDGGPYAYFSWSAAKVRDPLETNPVTLFNRVFSNVTAAGDPNAAIASRRGRSVIDFVQGEAEDLQKTLGTEDKRRIDQHLTSIRELEKSVIALGMPRTCAVPPKPDNPGGDFSRMTELTRTMIALHAVAHRCDLTRVSFISLGAGQSYFTFPHLGLQVPYHGITHDVPGVSLTPAVHGEMYRKVTTYFMEQVAAFLGEMSRNDGLGTLLDSSAVIATTEMAYGGGHAPSPLPIIVAGKAGRGGAGMQTGLTVAAAGRTINDLWQTALLAVGALSPGQKYGDPAFNPTPLADLWI